MMSYNYLAESHDSDPSDWFDISPKPHLLNNRQETENDGSKLWEEGVFPSLDSSLLIQVSCVIYMYRYIYVAMCIYSTTGEPLYRDISYSPFYKGYLSMRAFRI